MRLSFLCASDLTCLLSVSSRAEGCALYSLSSSVFLTESFAPSSGRDTPAPLSLGDALRVLRARPLWFSLCAAFSFTSVKGASFGNPMLWGAGGESGRLLFFQMPCITHNWGAVRSTCSLILHICSCFSLFSPCCFLSFT